MPYQGILTEGKLIIVEITCDIITAALVKTGTLSSVDGKCWINLDNGTFNFRDRIKFDGNKFSIYLSDNNTTIDDAIDDANDRIDDTNETVNNNYTTLDTKIDVTAGSITTQVSKTYATKDALSGVDNKVNNNYTTLDSKITQTANNLTATFTEMHNGGFEQGITTINKNGITVRHSNSNTYSKMDANGFYVCNSNGEPIASLGAVLSWTEMRADRVYANNILNIYLGDANLYIDHSKANGNGTQSSPFNNFNAIKTLLEATPIINKDITINVVSTGNVNDNLDLRGLQGRGTIKINLAKELVLNDSGANSAFYFYKVDNPITIYGNRSGYNSIDGALINRFNYGVYFDHCKYGSVEYLAIDTSGAGTEQWGVIFRNTNGKTSRVDFCDSWNGVLAENGSNVGDNDSVGNCKNAFYAQSGANIVFGSTEDSGYRPMGKLIRNVGCVTDLGNRAATASKRVATPAPTAQTYPQTIGYTGL